MSVRPASPADVPDIARVQLVTWRTAYRAVLPPAVLDDWDAAAAEAAWHAAIVSPPTPGHGVLVALDGGTIAGFAAYGPAELAEGEQTNALGPSSDVVALLVEPRWGRRGHGSRLLAAVVDLTRASGTARLQLWLPEPDEVTARFLEAAGWAPDGWVRVLDTGGTPMRQVRWHTTLDDDGREPQ